MATRDTVSDYQRRISQLEATHNAALAKHEGGAPSRSALMRGQVPRGGTSPERGTSAPASTAWRGRGKYFTLKQVIEAYPVFTPRLIRRLVQQRRIPFSRAGRVIVIAEGDIEAYLEGNRIEPPKTKIDWNSVA